MRKITIAIITALILIIPHSAFSQVSSDIQITAPWINQKTIKVTIINEANLSEEKIAIIKNAIESNTNYTKNGHTYFVGWTGALHAISPNSAKFVISESKKDVNADIKIELLKSTHAIYSGYTIPNYKKDKTVSASIQIFNSNNISPAQLENLIRHEFGHAIGLGHATDQNSIMYEFITSDEKLISDCDMTGLKGLTEGFVFTNLDCNHV